MGIKTYVPQLIPELMFDNYLDSEDEGSKKDLDLNEPAVKESMNEEETPTSSSPFSPPAPLADSKSVKEEGEDENENENEVEEDSDELTTLQALLNWFRLKMYYLGSCFNGQAPQTKNKKKRQQPSEDFEMDHRRFKQRRISSSKFA